MRKIPNFIIFFFLFFLEFQVNADQCNEKLIKDLPPNIPTSHLNPEELSKFIDQGLDLTLFLLMDENFDLRRDYLQVYMRGKQGEIKKFQEKYKFDSIKLPCKQKKKILSQVWKDNDNMMTNGYWVSSCTGDVGGPLRQFKFSKKHKPCDAKGNILEIPKLESKNQISKDFDEPKSKINSCNFELSREVIQTYSLFLPDIGRVTKEKKNMFEENLDWLLFIYKDEQIDKFIDFKKISNEVDNYYSDQATQKFINTDDELADYSYMQDSKFLKEIFSTFLKINDLSDVKLSCEEKHQILKVIKKDYEAYFKRLESENFRDLKKGIPDRKFKFIKRYQTEADYQNPLYSNTVFNRSYNNKLAPSNGAERIANFAILIANIFAGTNITPLNTTESLGSMKLALRNLTVAQSRFLEALGEDQMAIAVKQYASNLAGGKALGSDNLDKILIQTKEYQNVINQKIKSGYVLDNKAKKIFASGMSFYLNGIFNLVDTGLNVSQIVRNFSGGIAGVIQGIGLAFIAKDSLTALPLFFNSTGIIFDYANQSGIEDLDDLEKARDSLGV